LILHLFADDVITEFYALIADKDRRTSDQFSNLVLAFSAKRAVEQLAAILILGVIVVTH
jgi:hypothetical protein